MRKRDAARESQCDVAAVALEEVRPGRLLRKGLGEVHFDSWEQLALPLSEALRLELSSAPRGSRQNARPADAVQQRRASARASAAIRAS